LTCRKDKTPGPIWLSSDFDRTLGLFAQGLAFSPDVSQNFGEGVIPLTKTGIIVPVLWQRQNFPGVKMDAAGFCREETFG